MRSCIAVTCLALLLVGGACSRTEPRQEAAAPKAISQPPERVAASKKADSTERPVAEALPKRPDNSAPEPAPSSTPEVAAESAPQDIAQGAPMDAAAVSEARSDAATESAPESAPDPAAPPTQGASLQVNGEDAAATIDVTGLSAAELAALKNLDDEQRGAHLQVFVAELDAPPPLSGEVVVEGDVLRFKPRFSLAPGVNLRAVFTPAADATALTATLEVPKPPVIGTALLQIYPSARKLPENQLKFYLHFSAPMSRGEAYRHIHLEDEAGKVVDTPFLELGEELWDPTMTRFTLLCDPGRVKRGLKPREELGPVLEEGKSYILIIDSAWRDANGNPMASGGGRGIDTLAPDDTPVDPKQWTLEVPHTGSREPLIVRFGESLDHALLERLISVQAAGGQRLAGSIEIEDEETCWKFTPEEPWGAGPFQLVAATTLEDLAGNSIGRAFEVDEERPLDAEIKTETVAIDFQPKAAP